MGTAVLPDLRPKNYRRERLLCWVERQSFSRQKKLRSSILRTVPLCFLEGTAELSGEQTEKLASSEGLPERKAESRSEGTMPLEDGTVKLQQTEKTAQLYGQSGATKGGTERLNSSKEDRT